MQKPVRIAQVNAVYGPDVATAFAAALLEVCGRNAAAGRAQAQQHFAQALHWDAIARRTLAAYQELIAAKRRTA